jgi:holo-[acyl-carrier protein] synthase
MNALYGIGTDLVEVARLTSSLQRHGERFRDRIFHPGEIAYCESLAEASMYRSYAARFAAKEAFSKACRVGIGPAFDWVEIEVRHDDASAPYLALHGRAKTFAAQEGLGAIHLSLSHAEDHALAFAVVENG